MKDTQLGWAADRDRRRERKERIMTKRITVWLGVGLLLAGLPAVWAADSGTVSGKVVFKGTPPPPRAVPVTTDSPACGKEQQAEDLVVGPDKGIKYAVVRLVGAKVASEDAAKPVELDQKGCKFNPHVVIVPKGGTMDILNNDGIAHNIHSHSTANAEFNKAQPGFKKRMSQKFAEPERVKLSCDIHPWMGGWIVVSDGEPVAVTDASGSFKLANVPSGTYKLEVWQEKLGTQSREVTVKAGADASVTFELSRN
jgi:plastocyanin